MSKYVIAAEELAARLGEPGLVVTDCRFVLGQSDAGRTAYDEAHIPGAVYLDLERDLSAPVGAHGGRHPLPALDALAAALGRAGIGAGTEVVAYDDQGGAMASRLWWLLRYAGHDAVRVLDGGFAGWRRAGYAVTAEPPSVAPATFVPSPRPELLVDARRVREVVGAKAAGAGDTAALVTLIDSRDGARYRGEVEPIDRKAGHIPGAINRPFGEGRDAEGKWKSAAAQRERFADLPQDGEVIVYCGSGVTATPNVMALLEAGFTDVKLYAGSWSDWISYEENPVALGEEEQAKSE
ncbi:thiosulfate/3-mercaptopyruvate sulfurtransferase [Cohnella sp. OV330]|uniref:sulfurtransferase n=1 Tax=Cohnella sp. OV330 TaxID=1855288 RepID=UPI0008DF3C75|nr:sulfurtransferase [Cohnella sp. OV330]SFB49868.1 thiosulfate/3-mercaptopyruvate sulfurtransferase [Cohnella sp. OV330]